MALVVVVIAASGADASGRHAPVSARHFRDARSGAGTTVSSFKTR
jgi:hypothetical protein